MTTLATVRGWVQRAGSTELEANGPVRGQMSLKVTFLWGLAQF